MNILFLTFGRMESIEQHAIYTDLLRCFRNRGDEIYAVSACKKITGSESELILEKGSHIVHVVTGDIKKSKNLIKKGLAQLSVDRIFKNAIKKYFPEVRFDLVLYSTPPITFVSTIRYIKRRDNAITYLLLKDIFPQNAVDLNMLSKKGVKGLLYKYFRNKEKNLYKLSDHIGVMSQANADYVINNNPEIDPNKVEICPNSIEVIDKSIDFERKSTVREKYGIPKDKTVFVYGGNLGKPQGIDFLISCLKEASKIDKAYFLIIGDGTEYSKIEGFINNNEFSNIRLLSKIPKQEYDSMVGACDVGLLFLDHRFTIPNFPSRILVYMQARLPVLACTDRNTDVGNIIEEGRFGWKCISDSVNDFIKLIYSALDSDLIEKGNNAFNYLVENYSVESSYKTIQSHFDEKKIFKKKFYKGRLLVKHENKELIYYRGRIFICDADSRVKVDLANFCNGIKRVGMRFRFLERLLRLEPRLAIRVDNGYLITWQSKILNLKDDGEIVVEHKFRSGMNNPLCLIEISGFSTFRDGVYYGEYWGNHNQEPVSIWGRSKTGEWSVFYQFPKGTINHIHGLVPDKENERVFILTGDKDNESYFWESRNNFSLVNKYAGGSQQYRSCTAFVNAGEIIYATDTPLEKNYIYRLKDKLSTPDCIFYLPGSCIYGTDFYSPSGIRYFVFVTAVEPDSSLPKWRYKITRKLGSGIMDNYSHVYILSEFGECYEVLKAQKDLWPMWLFQFGNFRIANTDNGFAVTGQAIKKYDERTIEFTI